MVVVGQGVVVLAIAVALGEDAYEAWFAIEYALYVGRGDTRVDPGC